jgi:hypothetical protein
MTHSLTHNNSRPVNTGLTPKLARLKASLKKHRVTVWQISQASGLTDTYCWMVLNGRRRSVKVLETAERLLTERRARNKDGEA